MNHQLHNNNNKQPNQNHGPPKSLFVQCGEKVLQDQLYLVEQSTEIKSALRKVSSAFPFVRNEGIVYLLGVLRDLSDHSLDVVTTVEDAAISGSGSKGVEKGVGGGDRKGGSNPAPSNTTSTSISVAPLDTMTRISHHHGVGGTGGVVDPLREKRWYLASDKVLGSMNLVSCIFHRIIPRRDLLLALIGAGAGVGGGSPLEPILPQEAALMWCPAYKPSALLALHNKLAVSPTPNHPPPTTTTTNNNQSNQSNTSKEEGGGGGGDVEFRSRSGSGSPERRAGLNGGVNTPFSDKTGGSLLREVVASLKVAASNIRRKAQHNDDSDYDDDGDSNEHRHRNGGADSSPFQKEDCDVLDACLKEVSRRLDDGIIMNSTNHPSPSNHPQSATTPTPPSVNSLLESAVRESIGKGYLLASLALGHNGPPADSIIAGGGAPAGGGGGDTAVAALSGSTSTSELEAALRVIQGLCIFVPSQKANVADSPFIPFVIETCVCCLQHIQQLSLVERRTRCASGKLSDLLVKFSMLAAKEQQQQHQQRNNGVGGGASSSPLGDHGNGDDDGSEESSTTTTTSPPHQPVLSMRLDSIAVMCAMVDALEAVCHYSPPAVGQLVQMGGVKHLLNLAACPYTPPVLRCSILDTVSLLLQQGDPYRRAVLGQQAAAANNNAAASATSSSPNGGSSSEAAEKAIHDGISQQQAIVMETPVMIPPPVGATTHVGLASVPTDYPSLRAKGITVPLPPTTQQRNVASEHPFPISAVVGVTAPEHYRMDRATASKLDSAVRTWLASHQMFGSTASAILRLRDVSSGCGIGELKSGVAERGGGGGGSHRHAHGGGGGHSSSISSGNVAAYFSAVVRPTTSSSTTSISKTFLSSLSAPGGGGAQQQQQQQHQASRQQGRILQREIASLSSEREQAYLSILEEFNTKLVCCVSLE